MKQNTELKLIEAIEIDFESLPAGSRHDDQGRLLSCNEDGNKFVIVYDDELRAETYHRYDGKWSKFIHDDEGRVASCEKSDGKYIEFYRHHDGKRLVRELKDPEKGFHGLAIGDDGNYSLLWDSVRDLFVSGCRGPWSREAALEHWRDVAMAVSVSLEHLESAVGPLENRESLAGEDDDRRRLRRARLFIDLINQHAWTGYQYDPNFDFDSLSLLGYQYNGSGRVISFLGEDYAYYVVYDDALRTETHHYNDGSWAKLIQGDDGVVRCEKSDGSSFNELKT